MEHFLECVRPSAWIQKVHISGHEKNQRRSAMFTHKQKVQHEVPYATPVQSKRHYPILETMSPCTWCIQTKPKIFN